MKSRGHPVCLGKSRVDRVQTDRACGACPTVQSKHIANGKCLGMGAAGYTARRTFNCLDRSISAPVGDSTAIQNGIRDWIPAVPASLLDEDGSSYCACNNTLALKTRPARGNGSRLRVCIEQARLVINQWIRQYNHIRPHQALGMRPPVPETI